VEKGLARERVAMRSEIDIGERERVKGRSRSRKRKFLPEKVEREGEEERN
jgi:hypothetical protein